MKTIVCEILSQEELTFRTEILKIIGHASGGIAFEVFVHRRLTTPGFELTLKKLYPPRSPNSEKKRNNDTFIFVTSDSYT